MEADNWETKSPTEADNWDKINMNMKQTVWTLTETY